ADLLNVSDPNILWDLYEKLRSSNIFLWSEVTLFSEYYFKTSKSNAAISNVCRPAVERWQKRYRQARSEHEEQKRLFEHAKTLQDPVFIGNTEKAMKQAKTDLDALGVFKSDLVSFTRFYEFMSQIVDYDSADLEKLSLYARHLAPLLRESAPEEDPIDLSSVELSHYRLSEIRQQDLELVKDGASGLAPSSALGTGRAKSKEELLLSQIIERLNELFVTDGLTDQDLISYAYTIRDKVSENRRVMNQIANNSPEQALLGDFAGALDDAVMGSGEAHQNQMMQYLNSKDVQSGFQRIVFDLLLAQQVSDPEPFQRLVATVEDRWKNALPLVPLEAAAGAFSDPQPLDFAVLSQAPDWVRLRSHRTLRKGMFVAQVQGHSMEPRIPDGAYCLFQAPVAGSREGRVVLASHRGVADAEHGGRYTVKVYHSEKVQGVEADGDPADPESWRHGAIELRPINPKYQTLSLSSEDDVAIVAELIEVL
ncbi:MAG: S24 family peptidase, partial [Acidobacteriota bacterium]